VWLRYTGVVGMVFFYAWPCIVTEVTRCCKKVRTLQNILGAVLNDLSERDTEAFFVLPRRGKA